MLGLSSRPPLPQSSSSSSSFSSSTSLHASGIIRLVLLANPRAKHLDSPVRRPLIDRRTRWRTWRLGVWRIHRRLGSSSSGRVRLPTERCVVVGCLGRCRSRRPDRLLVPQSVLHCPLFLAVRNDSLDKLRVRVQMHSNQVQVVLIRLGSDRLYFIRFRILNTDHLFAGIDQPTCQEQLFEHRRAPLRSGRFRLREWIVLPEPPVTFDLEPPGISCASAPEINVEINIPA